MESSGCWKLLGIHFQMVCILGAAFTLFWCCWEYSKNEDVVEVSFKRYGEDPQSIYPDITLCFESPFSDEKLNLYGEGINNARYRYFLSGQAFDKRMLNIDYETVSLELKQHLLGTVLLSSSRRGQVTLDNSSINKITSFANVAAKCFTVHTPTGKRVISVMLKLQNTVFPSGFRPRNGFEVIFHYPEQLVRSWQLTIKNWPPRSNKTSKSYQMNIDVKDLEVLRRRNKRNNECAADGVSQTNYTVQKIMTLAECMPPYWKNLKNPGLSPCNTRKQLEAIRILSRMARSGTGPFQDDILPCNEIQKIGLEHLDTDFNVKDVFGDAGTDVELDATIINETWVANSKFHCY